MRWVIELHPDFPGPEQVMPHLIDPIVLQVPFGSEPEWPTLEAPFVTYATMRTITRMQRVPQLRDAVFDDYSLLRCSSYYRAVYDLLGRTCYVLPMTALPHAALQRAFGDRIFVRSDSNFKLFTASVIDTKDVAELVQQNAVHKDELVVVSEVVELGPEYRCFVRNGRVFAHSSYPNEPYEAAPADVIAFAEQAAARLAAQTTNNMWTIDVAKGDRLRLVEVGGVNSWGVYGCDISAFIAAMEAEARSRV